MEPAPPSPPTTPAASPASPPTDPLHAEYLLNSVIQVCDVLFGTTSILLAAFGGWLWLVDAASLSTVIGLAALPVFNTVWSLTTRRYNRVTIDLVRGVLCLPLATFLYIAEHGVLDKLWLPALLVAVGIGLTVGLSSRNSLLGCVMALGYSSTLVGAASVQFGGCDFVALDDGFGLLLTGCVISVVSSKLGRTLDEARRQRDSAHAQRDRAEAVMLQLTERSRELTCAIDDLHAEMEARMRVELELRHAHKLESVGRLAAGVAHEINTPVQFVSDSLQFVRDGMSDLFGAVDQFEGLRHAAHGTMPPPDRGPPADADLPYLVEHIPKALDRALEGLDRVATIVRSMKEFAHPDSKDMADADLNHAVESTLTIARNEYKYVAELETELGELPPVRCHVGELNQAVLNIVVNAAHAIGDVVQGTDTKGRIHVRTYRDADEVVIAITDTGGGIPEHTRDHIFEPFFTTKEVGRGTGQGLAIARRVIVDKHHGRLEFETAVGRGTTFFIRLAIDGGAHAVGAEAA